MKNSIKVDFVKNSELAKKIFHLLVLEFSQGNLLNIKDIELNTEQANIIIYLNSSNLKDIKKKQVF